jgi:hypothetical protein
MELHFIFPDLVEESTGWKGGGGPRHSTIRPNSTREKIKNK